MDFIETSLFTRLVYEYLTEEEYIGLQNFLFYSPESGAIIPGSGGVRKTRWRVKGRGKRGGVRVIYYFKKQNDEIWLLTIYQKNEVENIPLQILKQIAEEINDDQA